MQPHDAQIEAVVEFAQDICKCSRSFLAKARTARRVMKKVAKGASGDVSPLLRQLAIVSRMSGQLAFYLA